MSSAITSELEELLKVVGEEVIRAYRDKYFPARIIQACPSVYSIENASKWVNFDKFSLFVAHFLQERSLPPSPSNTGRSELDSTATEIRGPFLKRARKSSTSTCQTSAPDRPTTDTAESDNGIGSAGRSASRKRKRGTEHTSSLSKQSERRAAGMVQVTRQSWVNRVETLTETPEHWRVPETDESVAYILDLGGEPYEYEDSKGKPMTMSAIIKHKCTDAWAGGTGGSLSKATTVTLVGEGVKCQKMSHDCRGTFLCSRVATDLWKEYKRDSDDIEAALLRNGHKDVQTQESNTAHFERPVAFYNSVVKEKCQFDNGRCLGKPELKQDDYMFPINGRHPFVGCSEVITSDASPGHIFHQIPNKVDEGLLKHLFSTGRVNFSDTVVFNGPCTFTVPPRTGLKQKHCPHVHVQDGEIVEAAMQHRPCPAKFTIFSPVDHSIRKAVVIPAPGIAHNHPFCPWDKRMRRVKAATRVTDVSDPGLDNIDLVSDPPGVTGDSLNSQDVDSLNAPLPSDSSISPASMVPSYHMEQFYS